MGADQGAVGHRVLVVPALGEVIEVRSHTLRPGPARDGLVRRLPLAVALWQVMPARSRATTHRTPLTKNQLSEPVRPRSPALPATALQSAAKVRHSVRTAWPPSIRSRQIADTYASRFFTCGNPECQVIPAQDIAASAFKARLAAANWLTASAGIALRIISSPAPLRCWSQGHLTELPSAAQLGLGPRNLTDAVDLKFLSFEVRHRPRAGMAIVARLA
jgi:hypothetical protein